MARTLIITNDFPPRTGGIQSYVAAVAERLPADEVVVYASTWRGWQEWDRQVDYVVHREPTSVLLPVPAVRRKALQLLEKHGCTDVWFGAAAPLGLLAPSLRKAGAQRIVATTHGHEIGWARLPAGRRMLRRVAGAVDAVTYLGEFTRSRLAAAFGERAGVLTRMAPGVDASAFTPDLDGSQLRAELGLSGRPVIVCVSRLMPRKGQDVLIRALPQIQRRIPDAALLLVGGGPSRHSLERLAGQLDVAGDVVMTGSVPFADLPRHYVAGDVFAMPCRSRLGGIDVEGLGMVFLEASASGLPVVVGNSGGAPDAVIDGETGHLVSPESVEEVAGQLISLLEDPQAAREMGARGRQWVSTEWSWDRTMEAFERALAKAGR